MTKISEKEWGKNSFLFLWLCPNGLSHSKLDQNDPYGSNLRNIIKNV
jgi:hypothetical protein